VVVNASEDVLTTLGELAHQHISRLIESWAMLADFSFSDLVLYLPTPDPGSFVIVAHVRPVTGQTAYHADIVGGTRSAADRPLVARALDSGETVSGDVRIPTLDDRLRVTAIPVRTRGQVVAVIGQESPLSTRRSGGQLEAAYQQVFDRFAEMIADGRFPFSDVDEAIPAYAPRVGDGVVVTDHERIVTFQSPNAVSCLSRAGMGGPWLGEPVAETGFASLGVAEALATGRPVAEEVEGHRDVAITVRAFPLFSGGKLTGTAVLMRDVSDLRRRDRMLVSKDATIREIHHRVKNNLQTISSLLRIQGRRLSNPAARHSIEESVRRIRSIAIVHEMLSMDTRDDIRLGDVLRPLVRLVEEGLSSPDQPIEITIEGDAGVVPSPAATALAVVLTELLQNVLDHAFPPDLDLSEEPAAVRMLVRHDDGNLRVEIRDNGVGFDWPVADDSVQSLGLSIVHTLVEDELLGQIDYSSGGGGPGRRGTSVVVSCRPEPMPPR
jgi:two-component sensor histidine kinase